MLRSHLRGGLGLLSVDELWVAIIEVPSITVNSGLAVSRAIILYPDGFLRLIDKRISTREYASTQTFVVLLDLDS